MNEPELFLVYRHKDITGVSGTGIVGEGIIFSDGTVAMRWLDIDHDSPNYQRGVRPTTVLHENIQSVEAIHGHLGATEVVRGTYLRSFLDNLPSGEE